MRRRVLVGGIGNVFRGDDGFGVEVVRELSTRNLPEGVRLVDFGIHGFDLACALVEGYDAAILVDTTRRGGSPGTLYVIEPTPNEGPAMSDGHSPGPSSVLVLAKTLGEWVTPVRIVGCEPETFGNEEEGLMGLSAVVASALPAAVEMVERLVTEALDA